MKEKERYILVKVKNIDSPRKYINNILIEKIGTFGCAKASIMLLKEKKYPEVMIIKTNPEWKNEVIFALSLTKNITTMRTFGTLKKLRNYLEDEKNGSNTA